MNKGGLWADKSPILGNRHYIEIVSKKFLWLLHWVSSINAFRISRNIYAMFLFNPIVLILLQCNSRRFLGQHVSDCRCLSNVLPAKPVKYSCFNPAKGLSHQREQMDTEIMNTRRLSLQSFRNYGTE